jgi:hypothetical protein
MEGMSMMGGRVPQGRGDVGEAVASFTTYEAAQKAVSALIAGDVPAREIAIVGRGLRSIERVTGRLGYAAAARSGAINGVLLGLFFSAILVLGNPSVPIQAFVGVLFVGIAIGMLLSIVTYSFVRRRRDFASVMQVTADSYEVTVSASAIQRARQILGTAMPAASPASPASPSRTTAAPVAPVASAPPDSAERPRYGERVAPASTGQESRRESPLAKAPPPATPSQDATSPDDAPSTRAQPSAPPEREPSGPEPSEPEPGESDPADRH